MMGNNMCNKDSISLSSFEKVYSWIDEKYKNIERINALMPYGNKYKLFFRGESNNTYEESLMNINFIMKH